jgi:hypothetical protein
MHERQLPRLCRSCGAPMGLQEEKCRRCGANWDSSDGPRNALQAIPGGALAHRQEARQPRIPTTVLGNARAATEARLDADRWIDEGGSLSAEATALSANAAKRSRKCSPCSSRTTAAGSHRTRLAAEDRRETNPHSYPQEVHCDADAIRSVPRV